MEKIELMILNLLSSTITGMIREGWNARANTLTSIFVFSTLSLSIVWISIAIYCFFIQDNTKSAAAFYSSIMLFTVAAMTQIIIWIWTRRRETHIKDQIRQKFDSISLDKMHPLIRSNLKLKFLLPGLFLLTCFIYRKKLSNAFNHFTKGLQ